MKFTIDTDLSIAGTSIKMDDENISEKSKVASITFFADAPNKRYSDDGYISVSITSIDDEGNLKRENYSKTKDAENITPIGIEDSVQFAESDVIRFLGDAIDAEKTTLVDSIIEKCIEDKVACPEKDILLNRTMASLKDKAIDLGISVEDA